MVSIASLDLLPNPDLEVIANNAVNKVDQPLLGDLPDLAFIGEIVKNLWVVTAPDEDIGDAKTLVLRYRQMLGMLTWHICRI